MCLEARKSKSHGGTRTSLRSLEQAESASESSKKHGCERFPSSACNDDGADYDSVG